MSPTHSSRSTFAEWPELPALNGNIANIILKMLSCLYSAGELRSLIINYF